MAHQAPAQQPLGQQPNLATFAQGLTIAAQGLTAVAQEAPHLANIPAVQQGNAILQAIQALGNRIDLRLDKLEHRHVHIPPAPSPPSLTQL